MVPFLKEEEEEDKVAAAANSTFVMLTPDRFQWCPPHGRRSTGPSARPPRQGDQPVLPLKFHYLKGSVSPLGCISI